MIAVRVRTEKVGEPEQEKEKKPYVLCSMLCAMSCLLALLCLFNAGCGLKTGRTDEAESIIDAIESAQAAVGDESQIARVPRYTKEKDDIEITIENGKLSCDLVNVDLREVLLKIADTAQLQFVFSENIYGRVNAKFKNIELEEGIRLILDSAHYTMEEKAGVYSIVRAPDAPSAAKYHEVRLRYVTVEDLMKRIAAFYRIPYEIDEQSADGGFYEQSESEEEETIEMQPFAGPTSLKMQDVNIVKAIDRNVLLISGEGSKVDELLELIAALDQKVPQVLIETYLVEYDEDALKESGLDLTIEAVRDLATLTFSRPAAILSMPSILDGAYKRVWEDEEANGDTTSDGGDEFTDFSQDYTDSGDDSGGTASDRSVSIAGKIHALIDENKVTIISKPYIIVGNGAQAIITAASEQYVIAALPGEQLAAASLQQVQTKTSFTILPTIISDSQIHVQLSLEQSEFTTPGPSAVLSTNRNTARTDLVVDNGETIVIGGINSSKESMGDRGVPVLRSIPVLKYIFGASKKSSSSRKVSFYITPHILPLEEEVVGERIE